MREYVRDGSCKFIGPESLMGHESRWVREFEWVDVCQKNFLHVMPTMAKHTMSSIHFDEGQSDMYIVTKLNFDEGQSEMYMCRTYGRATKCQNDDSCSDCGRLSGWIYDDLKSKVFGSNMCTTGGE